MSIWHDGMYGLIVGDALGVPVEFTSRRDRMYDPVINMRAYGTHCQPAGTWSDDSSMAIATLESIRSKGELDYTDMQDRFVDWYLHGAYTPFNTTFDIGCATAKALRNFCEGAKALESGGGGERDNGNGSLMRILPVCLYLYEKQKKVCTSEDESIYAVHAASSLTHAHLRSQMGCGIYYFVVQAIIDGRGEKALGQCLQDGIDRAFGYYRQDNRNNAELGRYWRLADLNEFRVAEESSISSSGYVVHTLEAAIWCLLNTSSYAEAVLKAVNLGDDTDTVGAVTGGLAGLFYGFDAIPAEWVDSIQRKDYIDSLL